MRKGVASLTQKSGYSQDPFNEDEFWEKEEPEASKRICHKVPYQPLMTINFTTNPFEIEKVKKKKEKKKSPKPLKFRKNKRLKLSEIPKPKGANAILPPSMLNGLASTILKTKLAELKSRFGLSDYMFSTEPVLRYEWDGKSDPCKYLDSIRDIEEELLRFEPYQEKLAACVESRKNRKIKEAIERADKIAAGEPVPEKRRTTLSSHRQEVRERRTSVCRIVEEKEARRPQQEDYSRKHHRRNYQTANSFRLLSPSDFGNAAQ